MIALELSLRGLLRNFGLKVGAIFHAAGSTTVRELVDGKCPCCKQHPSQCCVRAPACAMNWQGSNVHVRLLAKDDAVV